MREALLRASISSSFIRLSLTALPLRLLCFSKTLFLKLFLSPSLQTRQLLDMAAVNLQNKESSLNDDALLPESKKFSWSKSGAGSLSIGSSWSSLSSPFGSEVGSTETESEEDDDEFMAQLTRQMADYMLQDDDDESANKECESMKFEVSSECSATSIPQRDFQAFGDKQDQQNHLSKVKNQPSVKNQRTKRNKEAAYVTESTQRPLAKGAESTQPQNLKKPHRGQNRAAGILGSSPPVVWPPLQPPQQVNYRSGMRAVFLGGPDSKTSCSGTGVFLPGGASNIREVRKKSGCSTVLIPTRVLHTLQLHFQNVSNQSQSNGPVGFRSYRPQHGTPLPQGINSSQEKQRTRAQSHFANKTSDIDLPQEWTY